MLPMCKASCVPETHGGPPLLQLGWRNGGYRMGNGARHGLGATGETNGTKAAVILANPIRATYRTTTPSPPHRDDINSEPGRASPNDVGCEL